MKCPFCAHEETSVINSRPDREGKSIRRRRECTQCQRRFTTYEVREEITPYVRKKNGSREPFDRAKLQRSLEHATRKRPVSQEQLEQFVTDFYQTLQDQMQAEISSGEIGDRVMGFLHTVDQVSYVRFASVYKDFRDVDEFVHTVSRLLKKDDPQPA
jgi:transcriptional repressor NrdR